MNTPTLDSINTILLRRQRAMIVAPGIAAANNHKLVGPRALASVAKHMEQLGFVPTAELWERLQTLDEAGLAHVNTSLVGTLRKLVGAKASMTPMYPNFPREVMEASEATLYINAMMHYIGDLLGLRIMPDIEKEPRSPLFKGLELKPIGLAAPDAAQVLAKQLMSVPTSLSATDKSDVTLIVTVFMAADGVEVASLMPEDIPHKENLCHVAATLLSDPVAADVLLRRYFKTATDVLRLAVSLSDGDVSLADKCKFKSFNRKTRRLLLALLERCKHLEEDMNRRREVFKRLGERLHPGEYQSRFPKAAAAFAVMRSAARVDTFASRVELALAKKDVSTAVKQLEMRPGELARRLDHLLRLESDGVQTVAAFERVCASVATPVLLQLIAHFQTRHEASGIRAFFPKGNVARVATVEEPLPALSQEPVSKVISAAKAALTDRFADRKSLGKVFIDPVLQDYPVPLGQRSASKSLRTLVRGSRLPLPDADTLRFFLWWKEGKVAGQHTGRVDVDLSAVFYDPQWQLRAHVAYTNLRETTINACHSGDITSAPKGACEFIDVDIVAALKAGIRYVVMSVYCFSTHSFVALPECYAGWMAREAPQSGEVFEPKTVVDRLDLAADKRIAVPAIIDLETRELLWCDMALSHQPKLHTNVEANERGLQHVARAMVSRVLPNLHDLLSLHVKARGESVVSRDEADVVFGPDGDLTPFDLDVIMSEYL